MEIEIFEEDGDNTLSLDDKYADITVDIYPATKTFSSRTSLKDDVYYRTEQFEYRIKTNPIKVETRLTERLDEPPPDEYKVKDGVVLESDILKGGTINGRETNQAQNLVERQDIPAMRDFVAAIGSNRRLASGTLSVDFKKPFSYLAETQERTRSVQNIFERDKLWWTRGESDP